MVTRTALPVPKVMRANHVDSIQAHADSAASSLPSTEEGMLQPCLPQPDDPGLTLTLGVGATAQTTITPIPPANGASAPAGASRPAVDPTAPKPFLDVIRGAREQPGLFPIWRKDEKVWLEIPKAAFNKPFLFSVNVANSLGERGLYASQMDDSHLVEWRRIGNQVQLVALNTAFRAEGDTKAMVEQSFPQPDHRGHGGRAGPPGSQVHPGGCGHVPVRHPWLRPSWK